jgi:hypothetical protein
MNFAAIKPENRLHDKVDKATIGSTRNSLGDSVGVFKLASEMW